MSVLSLGTGKEHLNLIAKAFFESKIAFALLTRTILSTVKIRYFINVN